MVKKVTRGINKLLSGVKNSTEKEDIVEKINNMKYAVEELGVVQDELIGIIDDHVTVDYYGNVHTILGILIEEIKPLFDKWTSNHSKVCHSMTD